MQKGIWFVCLMLLLVGCNDREKVTIYPSTSTDDEQQAQEIKRLIEKSDQVEEANVVFMHNELFVALQLKPLKKWNKQKIENQWKEKLESQYTNQTVHVSTDFKLFWESSKLMEEKDTEKVLDKIQQLKKLAKEET
ncbi:MAG: YhcN/YlaJ family sporulation lipoprotein [Solibacillus sp.]|uniref:YhcN/YlaJ family sporulation lipoprotein n=1 Tax=unclassified Solibacillus TaxID=2637870 RepID=UPI0030FBB80D